jgi:hypothetical protein
MEARATSFDPRKGELRSDHPRTSEPLASGSPECAARDLRLVVCEHVRVNFLTKLTARPTTDFIARGFHPNLLRAGDDGEAADVVATLEQRGDGRPPT